MRRIISGVIEEFRDVQPLDEQRRSKLQLKYCELVEYISLSGDLLDDMMSSGCITRQQMEAVKELNGSSSEKKRKLLDILTRRSIAHYKIFITCLRRSGHILLANNLEDDKGKRQGLIFGYNSFKFDQLSQCTLCPYSYHYQHCQSVSLLRSVSSHSQRICYLASSQETYSRPTLQLSANPQPLSHIQDN